MSVTLSLSSKIPASLILFFGTFVFAILPVCLRRTLRSSGCYKKVTSFLIYFGGGVLLATCLIHLFPEVRESFEEYWKRFTPLINVTGEPDFNTTADDDGEHEDERYPTPEFVIGCGFFGVYLIQVIIRWFGNYDHPTTVPLLTMNAVPPSNDEPDQQNPNALGVFYSLLTFVPLFLHCLVEGFTIGMQKTDKDMWIMFGAVSLQKFVIAFVVGFEVLERGHRERLVTICMAFFALMSPLGMWIAIVAKENIEDSFPLLIGVFKAIATGALFYVTFCEILQRESECKLSGWKQLLATFLGFLVMCDAEYFTTFAHITRALSLTNATALLISN